MLLILIALGAALAITSCGGSSQSSADDEPGLPRALASDLAERSDAIAAALDAGDVCGAATLADELKDAVDAAVAGGRIPPEFQDELEQTAVELQNGINCTEEPKEEDNDEDKGNGKKNGHGDETTTTGTTTEGTTVSTTEGEG